MIWFWWILGGLLALIALLLCLSIQIDLVYNANGFSGCLSLLFYHYRFPVPESKKKKAKPEALKQEGERKLPGGDLKTFLAMLRLTISACGKLLHTVRVHDLNAVITIASDDAFTTAMGFGGAAAGASILFPLLEQNFRVEHKQFSILADFEATVPTVNLDAHLSLRVGRLLKIALAFAYHFFQLQKKKEVQGKGESNGRSKLK